MKKTRLLAGALSTAALAAAILIAVGCGKNEGGGNQPPTATRVSAEKNSFQEVTSHLDTGGSLYLYLSTEAWLDGLSGKVQGWRDFANSFPNVKDADRQNLMRGFDVVTSLIKNSGVEDISGVGVSSIAWEKGFYHTKSIVHHYKGKGSGYIWSMFGKSPHPLTGLDLLPTTTAAAAFSDVDVALIMSALEKEIGKSGIPGAAEGWQKIPDGFAKATGLKLEDVLNSLGGEYGLVITLDEAKQISLPGQGGQGQGLQVPEPGVILFVKVKDDVIFDRVDKAMADKPGLIKTDREGLKMRTMPVPLPVIALRPSLARSGDYLILASSDALIEEVLAVKAGKKPGLKSTDEFKKLAQGMPEQGNQFGYMSAKFGKTVQQIQAKAMENAPKNAGQADFFKKLMSMNSQSAFSYSVSLNGDDGWMSENNGSQDPSKAAMLVPVAVVGALTAIAIPNFVKARETAQRNACINNLRQIDIAKQQWATEKGKTAEDVPTWDDLKQYLGTSSGLAPTCPEGGTYRINKVGDKPTCSIPGHFIN
jgi:hypothetical protein